MLEVKKLNEIFDQINEYWQPHIVCELNGQHVKAAKFKGQFPMHKHDDEDEMFLVIRGEIQIEFTDYTKAIGEGEFIVIPKGVSHSPIATEEAHVLLFEPMSTLNTGDTENEYTHRDLKKL
ncbi:MAG: cupin domain-containing protein [Candidatus Kapaibacterium sp.]